MSKGGAAGGAVKGGKKKVSTFVIDCSKPMEDKIMDISSLEKFLQERIKVGGKPSALGDSVTVTHDKNKITVVANETSFSKRLRKNPSSTSHACGGGSAADESGLFDHFYGSYD